jgi:putative aminopeptidase FrvX
MRDTASDTGAFDTGAIAADATALAELPGGTGHEQVPIDWLQRRLAGKPGSRYVDEAGNLVWTFGPPPYRPGLRLATERLDRRPAGSVPLTHPLVAAVLRARRSVGLPDTTGDGSTDANAALAAGIPAVALGCCAGEDMHAPTERIRADSIAAGARQLRAVLREILD